MLKIWTRPKAASFLWIGFLLTAALSPVVIGQSERATPAPDEYVGSQTCGQRHAGIYKQFSATHMGRSLSPVSPALLETLGGLPASTYEAKMDRHFEVSTREGKLYQSEYQTAPDGWRRLPGPLPERVQCYRYSPTSRRKRASALSMKRAALRRNIFPKQWGPAWPCSITTTIAGLKRDSDALAAFKQVVALNPDSPVAHMDLEIALADQMNLEAALAEFTQAVRLAPNLAPAHYNRGRVLIDLSGMMKPSRTWRQRHASIPVPRVRGICWS